MSGSPLPPPVPNDAVTTTIGDRVRLKKGNLDGIIRFIGPLKNGNGVFYGVELNKPKMGDTNGSFGGKSYFKTSKNRGIFITKDDIAITYTDRNRHCSDLSTRVTVGDIVYFGSYEGIARFIGPMSHSKGIWYGIELNGPHGTNNGTMHDEWYFDCENHHGVIVRSTTFHIKKPRISDYNIFNHHRSQDSYELHKQFNGESFSVDIDVSKSRSMHNHNSHKKASKAYNTIYFVLSVLSFSFGAIIAALPTTIFYIIQTQTGIDEALLASTFLPVSILGIFVGIGSGYILDKVQHYHTVMAIYCLAASVAIIYVPYAHTYVDILLSFIIIDGASSGLAPALFVGIMRVYNINGSWIISLNMFILFLTMAIMPQVINFCIKKHNGDESGYKDAMYILAGVGVIVVLLFMFISSPKREQLVEDLEEIVKEVDYRRSILISQRQSAILPIRPELQEDVLSAIAEDEEEEFDLNFSMSPTNTHFSYIVPVGDIKHRTSVSMYIAPRIQTRLSIAFGSGYHNQRHFSMINELRKVIAQRQSLRNNESVLNDLMIEPSIVKTEEHNDDKKAKQQRIVWWFAVIAVINEFLKCSNRYSFIAYITTFIIESWNGLTATDGLDLITVYCAGQLTAQFITIFLLKLFKPETLSIVCSFIMVISSGLLVVALWIETTVKNALNLLYLVSFCNGFGSSPLFTTSLAFLCNIQPLTGMLSSLYNSTDAAAGLTISVCGLVIKLCGVTVLMYIQCGTAIAVFIIFVINKMIYERLIHNGDLELNDNRDDDEITQ